MNETKPDLRELLKLEMDRWLKDCGGELAWTTADVLDFCELVIPRITGGQS